MAVEIDGVQYSWSQAMCDECWWETHNFSPVRMVTAPTELCCLCGEPTNSGIYVRRDPRDVPFPRREED